jgi:hypothetical protein
MPPAPTRSLPLPHPAPLPPGFVEKNKDQIHEEASDLVKYSKQGSLHKAFALVEETQRRRAEAMALVRPGHWDALGCWDAVVLGCWG